MKILFNLLIISLLVSCAGSDTHKIVVLADGKKGYALTCYDERENCEREAERVCSGHYKVHDFVYKQSMNNDISVGVAKEEDKDSLTSVFEMTISCKSAD